MKSEAGGTTIKPKNREKSAAYPAVSISVCYDFIKQIDSLGGKAVSYASILDLMGLTSPATKSFLKRISASKQFGFITTGGSTAKLTDLARRILYPNTGEFESKKLLIEAFSNPPLYTMLIERFKDKAVPSQSQLSNILMNEYRIIKQVKDNAAKCFIESADYLGLLNNGVLCVGEVTKQSQNGFSYQEAQAATAQPDYIEPSQTIEFPTRQQENGYLFEIPTMDKRTARFYIPDGVKEKDIDYIKLCIEKMLSIFLENLKTEV